MADDPIIENANKISALLQERMRIKGKSLEGQIHKSGRRLPRKIKRAAQRVATASALAENPKLARQVDQTAVLADADRVIAHLVEIDPIEALKDKILITLAKFSAVLIIAVIAAIWIAHSRGMI